MLTESIIVPALIATAAAHLVMAGYAPCPPDPVEASDIAASFAILSDLKLHTSFPWHDFAARHCLTLLALMPRAASLSLVYRSSDSIPFAAAAPTTSPPQEAIATLLGQPTQNEIRDYLNNGANSLLEALFVLNRLAYEYAPDHPAPLLGASQPYALLLEEHLKTSGITSWPDGVRAITASWTQRELARLLISVSTTCAELDMN